MIPEPEVAKADWFRKGLGESIEVELQLARDDRALGESIVETARAADYTRDATIKVRVHHTDGTRMLDAREIGLPSTLGMLLESR